MERKLASVQKIVDVQPIENADAIEVATVLGWHCVVKKGEFKPGDYCIYFEVDSVLPVKPQYEFLRKSCYNSRFDGFRIKTIKLRGQVSQGLALPLNTIFDNIDIFNIQEGLDLTELLGVKKYEVEIPTSLGGNAKGNFPSFIPKTDEVRIQSVPVVLTRYNGVSFVVTEKLDGTSSTYYVKDGEFGFCSRNWDFKEDTENTYAKIAKKYDIKEKLRKLGKNIAIQGEIVGPAIQKNRYKLADHMLFVYHVFDIDNYRYFNHNDFEDFSTELGFSTVPIVARGIFLEESMKNVDEAVEYSIGQSLIHKDVQREGIVVKSALEKRDPDIGRLSFKVINPKYLLKYED